MLDWAALASEYDQLSTSLADPNMEQKTRIQQQKRYAQLATLLNLHNQIVELEKTITENTNQAEHEEGELKALYLEEVTECTHKKTVLEQELEDILYPSDPRDDRSVFLEIRAGTGGQEAALFAADLARMYNNYALARGWQASVAEEAVTDLGGYKELILHIQGKKVFKFLKFESGVHRVQRVPKTETAGRIHTSTVTVAVMPELEDVEITINQNDLRIDTYRAGGAGGQHVNRTDSAVRITHIPTGVVVACQDERSQIKNKAKALKILQARIMEADRLKKEAELSAARKQQMGTGERAEKVRTYNFPQNRVTDHRTEITLKKLDMVMEGDLDDLLNPLIEWDRAQRRAHTTV